MTRKVIAIVTIIAMMAFCFFAGKSAGIKYAIEEAVHFTVDCAAPETTYELFIELPDGNYYITTLFIC